MATIIRRNTAVSLAEDEHAVRLLQEPRAGVRGPMVAAVCVAALLVGVAMVLALPRALAVLLGLVPLLAVAAMLVLIPRRAVTIGDGLVQVSGRGGWTEPLSAYAGLHAWVDRWEVVPADREVTDITGRVEIVRGADEAQRYQEGVLTLEHRQDARRSIDLIRQPKGAIRSAVAQGLAQRLGVALRWTH
ncbi:hypothetical protein [Plastoroseomonas arctica]|uniref:Uncharacterized protein n=1 Tax=Plastoroseomonas arctica TaxID=1509237 RepID=A0AAF1JVQ5_9PROT|nr:hypothetical protein [Plastoroseomonas arctica]MBR0654742.1 hypothetical protein [Plastoroseomonas arctica]